MTELRPLVPGRLLVGGCPEGFDARYLARDRRPRRRAGDPCRARRRAAGGDARGACGSSRRSCRCWRFRPGTACPTTGSRRTREIAAARMATLAALAGGLRPAGGGADHGERRDAAGAGARRCWRRRASPPRSAARIDVAALRGYLARMGFQQAPTVTEPGEFAMRGGLIDLYPPGARGPVRLDLFGDVLESARRFDPETQRTTETVKRVELAPVSRGDPRRRRRSSGSAPATASDVRRGGQRRSALRGGQRRAQAPGLRALAAVLPRAAGDALRLSARARRCCSTTRPGAARAARWAALAEQYEARAAALAAKSKLGTVYKPVPPGELYLDEAGWEAAVAGRPLHQLSALPQPLGPGVIDAGGRIGRDFAPERQQEAVSLFGALAAHVAARRQGGRRGGRELLRGRARAAGGAAGRQRRDGRARDRAGGGARRAAAGCTSRSGRSSTASRRRG